MGNPTIRQVNQFDLCTDEFLCVVSNSNDGNEEHEVDTVHGVHVDPITHIV